MDKRELRFNVCAVLTGVIVSAGVLTAWDSVPVSASTSRPALNIEIRKDAATYFRRLRVDSQPVDTRPDELLKRSGAASSVAPVPVTTSATACEAAMLLSRKIDAVLDKLPARQDNADARAKLKKIQNDAAAYCAHAAPPREPISATETDNDCEQFSGAPARMIECEVREKMGQTYRGY